MEVIVVSCVVTVAALFVCFASPGVGCPKSQNGTGNKAQQKRNANSSPATLMGRRLSVKADFYFTVHLQNAIFLKSDCP